jgi:hypothetical protein
MTSTEFEEENEAKGGNLWTPIIGNHEGDFLAPYQKQQKALRNMRFIYPVLGILVILTSVLLFVPRLDTSKSTDDFFETVKTYGVFNPLVSAIIGVLIVASIAGYAFYIKRSLQHIKYTIRPILLLLWTGLTVFLILNYASLTNEYGELKSWVLTEKQIVVEGSDSDGRTVGLDSEGRPVSFVFKEEGNRISIEDIKVTEKE